MHKAFEVEPEGSLGRIEDVSFQVVICPTVAQHLFFVCVGRVCSRGSELGLSSDTFTASCGQGARAQTSSPYFSNTILL